MLYLVEFNNNLLDVKIDGIQGNGNIEKNFGSKFHDIQL